MGKFHLHIWRYLLNDYQAPCYIGYAAYRMIHNTKSGSISFEFLILKIIHCKKQLFEVAYEKHLRIDCPRNVEFRDLPEFHRRWI